MIHYVMSCAQIVIQLKSDLDCLFCLAFHFKPLNSMEIRGTITSRGDSKLLEV